MAEETTYYGLSKMNAGDKFSDDDYKHVHADREFMSRALWLGAEGHKHNNDGAGLTNPTDPLGYVLNANTGYLPGGTTIYYGYTWVDEFGAETAISPTTTVVTPSAVATPGAPALSFDTGGTLTTGSYYYLLTAYTGVSTQETVPGAETYMTVAQGTTNGEITLTLPTLPTSADGFNVYRRSIGSPRFYHLATVDMTVATPPTTYVDDGSTSVNTTRTVPVTNTTLANYSVDLTLSGATPVVPDGYTWKIYRKFGSDNWENSLLHWVVEETSEGSGIVTPTYTDNGGSTSTGMAPSSSQFLTSPSKIDLNDVAEVQNYLPPGRNIIPHQITFVLGGLINGPFTGEAVWICEFDEIEIVHCRASLGRDKTTSTDMIVDVNYMSDSMATPDWTTIYTTQANRPMISNGDNKGSIATPDVTRLYRGDCLCIDVDKGDTGATSTAEDLSVTVFMLVRSESATTSHTWATS